MVCVCVCVVTYIQVSVKVKGIGPFGAVVTLQVVVISQIQMLEIELRLSGRTASACNC